MSAKRASSRAVGKREETRKWRLEWSCHMAIDDGTGKRFWHPRCYGGANGGKKECTCDPEVNFALSLERDGLPVEIRQRKFYRRVTA